jgi:O-antigen/teichoic acid export membrane protein
MQNTLWMTAASLGGRVISYGTFVLLARFFRAADVGVWAVLLTASLFSEVLSNLGLDKILIRDAARDPALGEALLPKVLAIKLGASVAVGAAACLCVHFGYPEIAENHSPAMILFFVSVPAIAVTRTMEAWHTAWERMHIPALAQILERVILICLLLAIWAARAGFGTFIAASAIAPIVRCLAALWPARAEFRLAMPRNSWPLFSESLILFSMEIITGVYQRFDLILISKLISLDAAGLYNAAYRVFESSTVIFAGYLLAIFPALARKARLAEFKNTFILGMAVVGAAGALGILFRNPVLELFGSRYLEAAPAFVVLMIALPMTYATSFMVNSLIAMGKTRDILCIALLVASTNGLFNLLLIPRYSLTGAALAFALSELVSIGIIAYILRGSRSRPKAGCA